MHTALADKWRFMGSLVALVALAGTTGCTSREGEMASEEREKAAQVQQRVSSWTLPTHAVVGYWHNFKNDSGCPIPLREVLTRAPYWDVINIAFAERDPAGDGYVMFHVFNNSMSENCDLTGLSEQDFKDDIAYLQSQGKIVPLSLGGAEGTVTLANSTHEDNYVDSLTSLINEYGFDGLDVDYESGSGISHEGSIIRNKHLSNALKRINQNVGGNMYLSMAPEHPYVQGGVVAYTGIWGSYLPLIDDLRDELDLLHVQLYNNSSSPNPWGSFPVDSVDNLVASVKMLIEGFQPSGGPFFTGLPATKVAFGVPSGPKSSNPPHISHSTLKNAFDCVTSGSNCGTVTMASSQPNFRGIMSWSINWDEYDKSHNTSSRIDFADLKIHMGGGSCTPNCGDRQCGDDGCGGSCGSCQSGEVCTGSGQCSSSCTPRTCSQISASCGSPSDGCGGTLSCGTCNAPWECNSSFTCVSPMKGHFKFDSFWNTHTIIDETNTSNFKQTDSNKRPATVDGRIGSALQFDGVDDVLISESISNIHSSLTGTSGVSVATWIRSNGPKTNCTGLECSQHIFYSYATHDDGGLTMHITENYELACGARPTSGATNPFSEVKIQYTWAGEWIHAACTFDAANKRIRIYVNGKEVTNAAVVWDASSFVNANSSKADMIGAGPAASGGSGCSSAAWNSGTTYWQGDTASLNGYEYTAAYWNLGDDPSLDANCCSGGKPWVSRVPCGGSSSSPSFFRGALDQMKLFSKVLSLSEIVNLFEEGGGQSCTPATCDSGECGSKPDGCGGTVACGSCGSGQTCNANNQCVSSCTPATCGTGDCGAKPDGCGGTLSCGGCGSGQSCNASFRCEATCQPFSCPAGACGTMSDGCSGTLHCGTCESGYSCSSTNECVLAQDGGGCGGMQAWTGTEAWTNYTSGSLRTHASRKWQCHTPGWCYLEPGSGLSSLGWSDEGGC